LSAARPGDGGRRAALLLCLALVPGLAGNMTFQALIPDLQGELALSATQVGWISTANYLAYALAAPLLVGATDRIDARSVMAVGLAVSVVAGIGFALLVQDFWSALLWRAVAGVGIAGTYMPGLKALTDRTSGPGQPRLQALFTAVYSVGTAASTWLSGLLAVAAGWRPAFLVTGLLPVAAALLLPALGGHRPAGRTATGRGGPRAVLAQRRALGFALAYGAHCFELFGLRTWLVAFLVFAAAEGGAAVDRAWIAMLATIVLLLGLPASLVGNELAGRLPRAPTVAALMLASAALGAALGQAVPLGFPVVVALTLLYGWLVMSDSSAITVGTVQAAAPELKGQTLAAQTLLGSVGAMLAPLLSGLVLDLVGPDTVGGWTAALATVAAGALLGPLALRRLARD
jgi:MFS family permease